MFHSLFVRIVVWHSVGLLLHVKTVGVLIRNIIWQILNLLNKKGLDIWVKIWFVEGLDGI